MKQKCNTPADVRNEEMKLLESADNNGFITTTLPDGYVELTVDLNGESKTFWSRYDVAVA